MKFDDVNGHEVKFYVDEQKKTVCAVINDCEEDAMHFLADRSLAGLKAAMSYGFYMPSKVHALAKCSPADVYNEEIGKRIAYVKLLKKYWQKMYKRANTAVRLMLEDTADIEDTRDDLACISDKADTLCSEYLRNFN